MAPTASRELIAVYPGSFDPITCGHVVIAERAAKLFSKVIIAVGVHPTKSGYFPIDERVELVSRSIEHIPNAEADSFDGLVVEYCREREARVIVRGLRAVSDFEPEFQMGLANRDLAPEIETVFLIPPPDQQFISSSLVREIASHGGNFERYVPLAVSDAILSRVSSSPNK